MKPTRFHVFITVFLLSIIPLPLSASGKNEVPDEKVLNVYCYDSFSSEWGAGPAIAESFYNETGIRVLYNAPGDGVTVLNQIILDNNKSYGDVVVGLDSSLLNRTLEADILEVYDSPMLENVSQELVFDKTLHLIPYDYGHFAICYDSDLMPDPPGSLEDLCSEKYTDSLILMDPRTSTPGLGFLLWTVSVYGEKWPEYWKRLKPSILTITEGWSQGYTLFTAGEAPMVLSYGSSPVYHAEYEGKDNIRAAAFSDGHILQIEGMGILKNTENRKEAELFIDFMLNEQSQKTLAMSNIMFPVNNSVELPESFEMALRPEKVFGIPELLSSGDAHELTDLWTEVFSH